MGKIADLVNRLDPYHMSKEELHELAALLDSLSSINNSLVRWGFPGGIINEGPGIDITGTNRIGVGHDSILLMDSSKTSAREYDVTATGLDLALAAATTGDIIILPPCSIGGNHTMIAGVSVVGYSRYSSKLTGQITMAASATLERLSVSRTANDASNYKCVINQATGTSYIADCDIEITQSGSGNAYAISLDGAGNVELWNCLTYASSTSGSGYAGYDGSGGGSIYFFGGRLYGSTDEFG